MIASQVSCADGGSPYRRWLQHPAVVVVVPAPVPLVVLPSSFFFLPPSHRTCALHPTCY